MQKTALLICLRKTAGRFLLKFDYFWSPVFLTLLPQARNEQAHFRAETETACGSHITGIAPLRGSLRAAPFGTGVPTLVLSSQDRSATICFLDGRTRFPPCLPLLCRLLCTDGSSRSLQCRCPFSVFTRHTSGCISASGYALYKVRVEKYSPFQYYAGIEHNSMTDSQKLPIKFIKNLSFDRVFLCFRLTPD